jgi:hypothetical protein
VTHTTMSAKGTRLRQHTHTTHDTRTHTLRS